MGQLHPVNKSFCLEKICESNFHKLQRLAPKLAYMDHCAVAEAHGKPELYLEVIDKTKYTLTLQLSHRFGDSSQPAMEPTLTLRVYLDAKSAEVLHDANHLPAVEPLDKGTDIHTMMDYKWSLNYFLDKWLSHCLSSGYRFNKTVPLEEAV